MLLGLQQYRSLNSFTSIFSKAKAVVTEATPLNFYRQTLNNSRILVVDGHTDTCDLFALVLEEAGAEVVVANSCREALMQIQKNPPDILISEIALPDESGFTLIRKTGELMAEAGQIPLALAVTSYVESVDKLEISSAGFQRCLSKPVDIYELVNVVTELVMQKQNSQSF
jgi:two-component system, OmpR family, response regulator